MEIEFWSTNESLSFHSPLADMALVTGNIERRIDPLSGHVAILSSFLGDKRAILFPDTDFEMLEELVRTSRPNCFFCPQKVEAVTPRYTEELLAGGAVRKGECFLFPNLFPVSAIHAVVAVGHEHHRHLDNFPGTLLGDGIGCALTLLRSVSKTQPSMSYFTLNSNYLFPGGASIVHPHFQLLGSAYPCKVVSDLTSLCRAFKDAHGADYFESLIETEENNGVRIIHSGGAVRWLSVFAPTGVNEVLGVVPGVTDISQLTDDAVADLGSGLSKVLAAYHEIGFSTFNFSILSGPVGGDAGFPVMIKVVSRQNVHKNHRTDDYFVQKMLNEELIVTPPETLAEKLRLLF